MNASEPTIFTYRHLTDLVEKEAIAFLKKNNLDKKIEIVNQNGHLTSAVFGRPTNSNQPSKQLVANSRYFKKQDICSLETKNKTLELIPQKLRILAAKIESLEKGK